MDVICLEPTSLSLEVSHCLDAATPSCQPRRTFHHLHSIYYPPPPHCSHTDNLTQPATRNLENASSNKVTFSITGISVKMSDRPFFYTFAPLQTDLKNRENK